MRKPGQRAGLRAFRADASEIEHSAVHRRRRRSGHPRPPSIRPQMTALQPLRSPAFRRLATTYTLDEVAWSFGTVALAILVYARTSSALAATALFLASTFVPALLAPALTARLDRLPVRRALPALYLVEAALYLVLVVAAGLFWLPLVLVLAIGDGAIAIVGRAVTPAALSAGPKPEGYVHRRKKK